MSHLLALAAFALAQPSGVDLKAEFAWDGIYRAGREAPVHVTITNKGPEIQGAILLRWASPATQQPSGVTWRDLRDAIGPTSSLPIAVPERSTRVHTAYVQTGEWARKSLWVFLVDRRERTLVAYELMGVAVQPAQPLVAIVGEKIPEGLRRASPGNVVVGCVAPAELPDRWHGFPCLDGLVWMDGDATTIRTPEQAEALRLWVASGGHLVVARSHPIGVADTFLAGLLPVELGAAVEHSRFASLGAFAGADPPAEQAALVLESRPLGGRVLFEEEGLPLAVERRYGRGRITFLAFDPSGEPFASWEGLSPFWRRLLDLPQTEPPPRDQRSPLLDPAMRHIGSTRLESLAGSFEGIEPPSLDWLFYLLAAYILLIGPVDYFVLRRLRRLEWTWITLAAYTLAFTGITLVAGMRLNRPSLMLQEMAVVDVYPDAGVVRGWTVAGALSPRPADMAVRLNAPHAWFAPVSLGTTAYIWRGYDVATTTEEPTNVQGVDSSLDAWRFQRGETRGLVAEWCGAGSAPVQFELRGESVVLTNSSDAPVSDALLLTPLGSYELGTIPPGRHERPLPATTSAVSLVSRSDLGLAPRGDEYGRWRYGGQQPLSPGTRRPEVRNALLGLSFAEARAGTTPPPGPNWGRTYTAQDAGVPAPRDRNGVARSIYIGDWVQGGGSVLLGWWESSGYIELSDRRPVRSAEVLIRVFQHD